MEKAKMKKRRMGGASKHEENALRKKGGTSIHEDMHSMPVKKVRACN